MHNPVFEPTDTLSFVLQACIIMYVNGKQFRCSVFTFVIPFVMDKSKYQKNSPNLTEVQWDISDLPFVQNKNNQY